MEALAEGVSYDTPRDGVTLSARRDLRSLVLPAEVARLENLTGYLKFPGAWPVARIKLKYKIRPKVAERFVPRAEGESGARSELRAASRADEAAATVCGEPAPVASPGEAKGGGVRDEFLDAGPPLPPAGSPAGEVAAPDIGTDTAAPPEAPPAGGGHDEEDEVAPPLPFRWPDEDSRSGTAEDEDGGEPGSAEERHSGNWQ